MTAIMAEIHLALALYCASTASASSRVEARVNRVKSGGTHRRVHCVVGNGLMVVGESGMLFSNWRSRHVTSHAMATRRSLT